MTTVTLEEAKTRLGDLLEKAAQGEPFLIEREGEPQIEVAVRVIPQPRASRLGGLEGKLAVPDDFDSFMADEMETMFYGTGE